jgi:DNA modification methylase
MVILDPFMGTGSTIEACIRTERNYIGIEINKEFYQHTENRISSLCGGLFSNSFSAESSIETE